MIHMDKDFYAKGANLANQHVPHFNKFYRGYVLDVLDHYNNGRVKVYIPELMAINPKIKPNKDGIWVNPVTHMEGQHLPTYKNFWVLVYFEDNDPNRGFYLGAIHLNDWPLLELRKESKRKYSESYINAFPDKSKTLPPEKNKKKIELAACDYVMLRTPRRAHFITAEDHKENKFIEARTGDKIYFTMHDTKIYAELRTKGQNCLVMVDKGKWAIGKFNPETFITLATPKNIHLTFKEERDLSVYAHKSSSTIFMDGKAKTHAFVYQMGSVPRDKYNNLKLPYPNNEYDVWYQFRYEMNDQKYQQLLQKVESMAKTGQGFSILGKTKKTRMHAYSAEVICDGNSGFVHLNPRS